MMLYDMYVYNGEESIIFGGLTLHQISCERPKRLIFLKAKTFRKFGFITILRRFAPDRILGGGRGTLYYGAMGQ